MQKMTSAYANKMLRNLEEEKAYWLNKEAVSSTYVASTDEEPVIPEYDYSTVASIIEMCIRDRLRGIHWKLIYQTETF